MPPQGTTAVTAAMSGCTAGAPFIKRSCVKCTGGFLQVCLGSLENVSSTKQSSPLRNYDNGSAQHTCSAFHARKFATRSPDKHHHNAHHSPCYDSKSGSASQASGSFSASRRSHARPPDAHDTSLVTALQYEMESLDEEFADMEASLRSAALSLG